MGKLKEMTMKIGRRAFFQVAPNSRAAMKAKSLVYRQLVENLTGNPPEPYKPLSPRYAAFKRKRYGNLPILYREGEALRHLKVKMQKTERGYRIASVTLSYMNYHLKGGERLPKRNWQKLPRSVIKQVTQLLAPKMSDER